MDRIKVSDEALRSAAVALQQLRDQATSISSSCVQQVTAQLPELESNFRKDVAQFLEEVKSLNEKIKMCVDENVSAIADRMTNLAEYETHTYQRRNIG